MFAASPVVLGFNDKTNSPTLTEAKVCARDIFQLTIY